MIDSIELLIGGVALNVGPSDAPSSLADPPRFMAIQFINKTRSEAILDSYKGVCRLLPLRPAQSLKFGEND